MQNIPQVVKEVTVSSVVTRGAKKKEEIELQEPGREKEDTVSSNGSERRGDFVVEERPARKIEAPEGRSASRTSARGSRGSLIRSVTSSALLR